MAALSAKFLRQYPTLDNYGEYMLVEVSSNISVIGHKFDALLSDVVEFLA